MNVTENERVNECMYLCKCDVQLNVYFRPYHLCNYHYFVMTIFMAMIVKVLLYFVCISVKA